MSKNVFFTSPGYRASMHMLKKIQSDQIRVGMFIHDLDCAWMNHPFVKNRFKLKHEKTIQKISASGITHVIIDTQKGLDLDTAPTIDEVEQSLQEQSEQIAESQTGLNKEVSVEEEINNAKSILAEAGKTIQDIMERVRFGKQMEVETVEPITIKIIDSIFRNKDALISLRRIKSKDEYTFMHSVSVGALTAAFSRALGRDRDEIIPIATGALLHDIGKARISLEILNKPGKLTEEEFQIVKSHVKHSCQILSSTSDMSPEALDIAAQHHERIDGSGYPCGLKGEEISTVGQMSAIVDVYDALTSERCYKGAWEPSFVLKKLLEWSPNHFKTELVHKFIRCLGVYPVGTLVQLASGLVGIVMEQCEKDLLRPTIRIVYNAKEGCYVPLKELNLAKNPQDCIQSAVPPEKYEIDLNDFT
jgi:putative nucleotidyltransferase with HDIG domain